MDFDVVVIGSGPGGYVAAANCAKKGLKTACIEKESSLGGTCLNVGCIPSKALLHSSHQFDFLQKKAAKHGIECESVKLNFSKMQQRKNEVVAGLAKGVAGYLKTSGVEVVSGTAKFISPQEIQVGDRTISSRYFILATGSESISLPFIKVDEKVIVTSTGALALEQVPKRMIVIGGGVIGVELASVYARLGSEVTCIEMLDAICPTMDSTATKALQNALKKQGITFYLGAKVQKCENSGKSAQLEVLVDDKVQKFEADVVLVAVGRRPYTEGLNLDAAGVKTGKGGLLDVDAGFATNQPHIFAVGDLISGPMLAHKAQDEGLAIATLLSGGKMEVNYFIIPNVVYTHPELASCGLTEDEAKTFGFELKVGTFSLKASGRAQASDEAEGLIKVIADKKTDRVLGVHILAANGSEMIGEAVVAIQNKATLGDLIDASHAHPTIAEGIKEAALVAMR